MEVPFKLQLHLFFLSFVLFCFFFFSLFPQQTKHSQRFKPIDLLKATAMLAGSWATKGVQARNIYEFLWPGQYSIALYVTTHHSDIWNLAPLCLMWTVWLERNSRTFEDVLCSTDQLLEKFANSLFDWLRVWGFSTADSVTDFIAFCFCFSYYFVTVGPSVCMLCAHNGFFFNIIPFTCQKKYMSRHT